MARRQNARLCGDIDNILNGGDGNDALNGGPGADTRKDNAGTNTGTACGPFTQ